MASGPILIGFASDRFSWVAVVLPTDSRPMLVSWNQSSFKKMQPMAAAEVVLKSPLIPLFQRGNYSIAVLTPLWKRGEGEISTRRYGNYLTNFNSRTLGEIANFRNSNQSLRLADLPRASKNMTLLPAASGEKNSVTSSSKKVSPDAPRP